MIVCPLCRLALSDDETTCPRDGGEGITAPDFDLADGLNERFELVQRYASGRTGELFLVDDRQTGRRGVLKLIRHREGATPAEIGRLKRELAKQANLTHAVLSVPMATGEVGRTRVGVSRMA